MTRDSGFIQTSATHHKENNMKTRTIHISNLGQFGSGLVPDSTGFVTIHDDPQYAAATEDQLKTMVDEQTGVVWNAAKCELIKRRIHARNDSSIAK